MLPPTAVTLADLADRSRRRGGAGRRAGHPPVLPKLVVGDDDAVAFLLPGDAGYPED